MRQKKRNKKQRKKVCNTQNWHLTFMKTVFFTSFSCTLERSNNSVCNTHIWWVGDVGNTSSLHPRWRIEELCKAVWYKWNENCRQVALCCGILAPIWGQGSQKEGCCQFYPVRWTISIWWFPFQELPPYGLLPVNGFVINRYWHKILNHIFILLHAFVSLALSYIIYEKWK